MTVLQPVVIALTMVLILWAHRLVDSFEPTVVSVDTTVESLE
jgi:hypothetical protein